MLSADRDFPKLNGNASYLAIKLYNKEKGIELDHQYALIEIPTAVISRFFVLPEKGERKNIVLLDDVIRNCLKHVFAIFKYDFVEAYTIKLTLDAELDIEDDVTSSLMENISQSVKNRRKGDPVRFVHDEEMPKDLLDFLIAKVGMDNDDVVVAGGRYHNFKDYIAFPKVGGAHLRYRAMPPLDHPKLKGKVGIFDVIKKQDVLISYPYQSYDYVIHLMREAAIDPAVSSIKITIYRVVDKNSKIMHSLINAARNGKSVTVVVELKARFDEETNMMYAHKLQDEGIKVIFGAPGLKVHAKVLVIKRKEDGKSVRYVHIGTGNYHESNAKLYSDHSLLTCREEIADEANKVFKFFKDNYKRYQFRHLIVAPFNARQQYYKLINKEIKNAQAGKEAYIIIKVNSLHDKEMTTRLYKASMAGVKIKIIARSINSVISGEKGYSENIEAVSVVDRLLEHARILVFANGGDEKVYMGSSDWMGRNLDGRIEIMTPIFDPEIKATLLKVLNFQLTDNTKARFWNKKLSNPYQKTKGGDVRAQYDIYNYFKDQLKDNEQLES
ncbi:MAG: polyphosphate kinase 1 [Flavobacteriales bacterium]|nr:polyphosphate kinase 1 [Flavobacteriales bacterium]